VNNYMSKPGSLFRVSLVIIPLLSVQARVVGMFTVTPTLAQAFAPCYISTTKTSLSSSSTSIITSNSSSSGSSKAIISSSIINNNTSSNLEQNILRNVQKRLEQNVIDFSLDNGS